ASPPPRRRRLAAAATAASPPPPPLLHIIPLFLFLFFLLSSSSFLFLFLLLSSTRSVFHLLPSISHHLLLQSSFEVTTRPDESVAASNPSFVDGVATKDIHIDPSTSLSIRIFLPESALNPPDPDSPSLHSKLKMLGPRRPDPDQNGDVVNGSYKKIWRRNSLGPAPASDKSDFFCRKLAKRRE
ncbi:Probable carboxylesterase 16, partial [Linum perenne]